MKTTKTYDAAGTDSVMEKVGCAEQDRQVQARTDPQRILAHLREHRDRTNDASALVDSFQKAERCCVGEVMPVTTARGRGNCTALLRYISIHFDVITHTWVQ